MEGMSKNEKISYRLRLNPKLSERMQGKNNPMYGKKVSTERRETYSILFAGEGNPYYGKKHPEEALEKMRLRKSNDKVDTRPTGQADPRPGLNDPLFPRP